MKFQFRRNPIEILAGQYYDQETGLHYNYHRYYDPKLGRYLRADPIGLAGGINPYTYVQNNPVNSIDPLGLMEVWEQGMDYIPDPQYPINNNISDYQKISTLVQLADFLPLQYIPSPYTIGAAAILDIASSIFGFYDIVNAYERGDINCEEYQTAVINWNMANVASLISYSRGIGGFGIGAEVYFYEMNLYLTTDSYNPFHEWW